MKAVILAGGLGTRISEESDLRPKPMIEIGGNPILWHLMKIYYTQGIDEFVICAGYKAHMIKEYFYNYILRASDVCFNMQDGKVDYLASIVESWKVCVVDTGLSTMTGGRLKQIEPYLKQGEPFLLTYGDGVADINLAKLINFHSSQGKLATVTIVPSPGRFGAVDLDEEDNTLVKQFKEKKDRQGVYISAGFFVLQPEVLKLIEDDNTIWEDGPLETLSSLGELSAYKHEGFWKPMDSLNDKRQLERLWLSNEAPWKIW